MIRPPPRSTRTDTLLPHTTPFRSLAEEIRRDRNRASIAIWSVGNETPVSDARNAFLTTLAKDAHAPDDSRLVSAALLVGRKEEGGTSVFTVDDPLIPAQIGRAHV